MRHGLLDLRIIPALILGGVVAFGLFLLMHAMISNNQNPNMNAQQSTIVNFVQVQHNEQIQTKNYNHPPPPPPPKKPPPQEKIQTNTNVSHHVQQLPVNVKFDTNSMGGSGVYINPNAGTNRGSYAPLTPMVRIKPLYPPQAQYQGVQGSVYTCFTVEPDGSVANPHVEHASSPQARQMLANAALQTILQWKFFPKKENGKPVATRGVCQSIQFHIGNNSG
ncbi:MAG: energy transducer TonB [Gammaproteobacteria bacterium]